jgi:ATP-binding cassette subfamily C exporter for protease/lipase
MLEVYDRVVNSRNSLTLLMLSLLALFAYATMEALAWARAGIMAGIAEKARQRLAGRVHDAAFEAMLRRRPGAGPQAEADLQAACAFVSGPVLCAFMDVPMGAAFLLCIFWINPWLGTLALGFALALGFFAGLSLSRAAAAQALAESSAMAAKAYAAQGLAATPAAAAAAMGMQEGFLRRWLERHAQMLKAQTEAAELAGAPTAASRFIQLASGSFLLGAGCWLIIDGKFEDSGGLLLAASILGGKLLAPLAQAAAGWRQFAHARLAMQRLSALLADIPEAQPKMPLPPPKGFLLVEGAFATPPGAARPVLRNLHFSVRPGCMLAVVGASGSGKSALAQLLIGAWPAAPGHVRLSGAEIHDWDKAELGPHIGYLPQGIALFEGSLAANICRFGQADPQKLAQALADAGIDPDDAALPSGLDSPAGGEGGALPGGLRQKAGLARAFYGNPKLIVLDEPDASLDAEGQAALAAAIARHKALGAAIVAITHRPALLSLADGILAVKDGHAALAATRQGALPTPQATQGKHAAK